MSGSAHRSWLLVSASKPADVERAAQSGADVVVLDLVELVGEKDKARARKDAERLIGAARSAGSEVFVQTDPDSANDDVRACVCGGLAGVVLSRTESPEHIERLADLLEQLESERGIAPGTLEIVAAVETARGNHAAYDIACASPRVSGLTLGRVDLVMDLRPEPSGEIHLLPYLMERLIAIAGAAGVTPIGAWWRAPDRGLLATAENTHAAAQRGRAIGFKGAMCLLPAQVDALNRGYEGSRAIRKTRTTHRASADRAQAVVREKTRMTVRRSGLTMPIVTPRFIDKAWTRGCDFITLDLEDSVPQHLKAHARTLVKDAIQKVSKGGAEVFVRINHDSMLDDLEGAVWPGVSRIKYPKTESAAEVRQLDEILTRLERERGIEPGTIEIDASIETALGVANVFDIASASTRVREFGATTGGYDLSRDLGVEMFVDFDQFVYPKGEAELAARTLRLGVRGAPFVANTTGSVSDGSRALRQAEAARQCGFHLGGGGLNPAVVEGHNIGLTPTEDDVRDAHWVLEQYRRLEDASDTWVEVKGRVIDRYEAERARHTIEWAALCANHNLEKSQAVAKAKSAESAATSRT